MKQAAAKAGIEIELKSVVASVFFSSDPANPDTYSHFYADLQMYNTSTGVDPQLGMRHSPPWEITGKDNKWAGRNITRWQNEEYDRSTRPPRPRWTRSSAPRHFIKMNDLVISNVVVIPVALAQRRGRGQLEARGSTCRAGTRPSGGSRTGTRPERGPGPEPGAVLDSFEVETISGHSPAHCRANPGGRNSDADEDDSVDEHDLRAMIEDVRSGPRHPPPLRPDHGRPRPHRSDGRPDAGVGRRRPGADEVGLQPDQAGRRRRAQGAVVAGAPRC